VHAASNACASQRTAIDRALRFGLYRDGSPLEFAQVVIDGARSAHLGDVFVRAPHRGEGLGRAP
jgi:hypothetical protein